jgi:hypothetical protein
VGSRVRVAVVVGPVVGTAVGAGVAVAAGRAVGTPVGTGVAVGPGAATTQAINVRLDSRTSANLLCTEPLLGGDATVSGWTVPIFLTTCALVFSPASIIL